MAPPTAESEDGLSQALRTLDELQDTRDTATHTRLVGEVRDLVRLHQAADRLLADPGYQDRLRKTLWQINSGNLSSSLTLAEFDEKYAEDLAEA